MSRCCGSFPEEQWAVCGEGTAWSCVLGDPGLGQCDLAWPAVPTPGHVLRGLAHLSRRQQLPREGPEGKLCHGRPLERPRLRGPSWQQHRRLCPFVRDQDSAGTPLAVTGSQDLSQVPAVQTWGDPQPDVGSGQDSPRPEQAEQALRELPWWRTHPGPARQTLR